MKETFLRQIQALKIQALKIPFLQFKIHIIASTESIIKITNYWIVINIKTYEILHL
jgi:hypothetical protein